MGARTDQSPAMLMGLETAARAVVAVVGRGLKALIAEHSLAQRAATKAALPRRRLRDIRALYTGPDSPNK